MKSIVQNKKECFICGTEYGLENHHIVFGKNRKNSDREGCTCWLCVAHHRGEHGVHGRDGNGMDIYLKQTAQQAFERLHSHEEWMRIFGKNYL